MWLRNFISGLKILDKISEPLKIYYDNDAKRHFAQNDKCSSESKYSEVKYLVLKKKVQDRSVSIVRAPMDLMNADSLTKALPPKAYKGHVLNMDLNELPY